MSLNLSNTSYNPIYSRAITANPQMGPQHLFLFLSREDLAHLHASGIDDADEALANWWYGRYGYHDNRMGFFQGKTIGKP